MFSTKSWQSMQTFDETQHISFQLFSKWIFKMRRKVFLGLYPWISISWGIYKPVSYKSCVTPIVSEESKEICAIRDVLLRKKCILLYFVQITSPRPLPPTFSCRRNSRFESHFRTKNTIHTIKYIKEIGVFRDTARAPQPPTNPPTGTKWASKAWPKMNKNANFGPNLVVFGKKF